MPLKPRTRKILKWIAWTFCIQVLLVNVSAAIYAWRFTHLEPAGTRQNEPRNIIQQTWHLFTGPKWSRLAPIQVADFAFEKQVWKLPGGASTNAWYARGADRLPCVVFVHGFSSDKSYLGKEAALLHRLGYTVLLFDLGNHGSHSASSHSFGFHETAELQFAEQRAHELGHREVVFYGVSMGANLVLKAAAESQIKPAGVILDMPYGSLHDHLRARARTMGFSTEPFASLVTFWIGAEQGYSGFSNNAISYASQVDCPVLLQWGDADPYVTRQEVETIFKAFPVQHRQFIVYQGAGHGSLAQADEERWHRSVSVFLTGL